MTKKKRAAKKRETPTPADLRALRDAYKAFESTAVARARAWRDIDKMSTNADVNAADKADADALEPVQRAWIKATSYVNSADRWPLVSEGMILNMLVEAKLWPGGLCVSEVAYQTVNGYR